MLAANTQTYALNFQYFEQQTTWSSKSGGKTGADRSAGIHSLTTRVTQLSLEVSRHSNVDFRNQSAAERLAVKLADGLPLSKFNQHGNLPTNQAEAKLLVGKDGYWGVEKTAERLTQFVLKGAGDNLEMLRAGREGLLRGFKEAEKIWGGKLPDISYKTIDKALAAVDERIQQLGGNIIDRAA
ncbi:hypothetical protein [Desulfurivibrio alkaliphilus]|uniref:Hydrogenase-4 component G n=1 Tax=Desulfurivibrio alkaliphilus (strain DSM 19089 / UNIQEM U267 / AHT2) TaxID=589865 RepID=D6Z6N9_DESAT|nr:hypothetical protein [Desulfurivibrio alkaliphilus]ADH84998.1 hypothetical protein DaAHT2_0287 [Desulfurivibrio alkaliphilus AHT 2]